MGCRKSSSKREVCSNTTLTQETRKASNRQPQLTPKTTDKEQQQKKKIAKISTWKEIIKIWTEINEKYMKETIAKINKLKAGSLRR